MAPISIVPVWMEEWYFWYAALPPVTSMYLSSMVSAFGRSSAASNRAPVAATSSAAPITMFLRTGKRFMVSPLLILFTNPAYRGIQHGVLPLQQLMARQLYFLIGFDPDSLQRLAAFGDVVGDGVLKSIAVGQLGEH